MRYLFNREKEFWSEQTEKAYAIYILSVKRWKWMRIGHRVENAVNDMPGRISLK